jgi:hypothetical protein
MWVKPCAIYTPEFRNTLVSLLSLENYVKILPSPAFSHILYPQATLLLLTTLKSSPLVQMTKNSLFMTAFLSLKWNPLNVQGSSIPLHIFWSLSFLYFVCMCCRPICMFSFLFVTSLHYPFLSLRFVYLILSCNLILLW